MHTQPYSHTRTHTRTDTHVLTQTNTDTYSHSHAHTHTHKFFSAVVTATEEAVVNALVAGEETTGFKGHRYPGFLGTSSVLPQYYLSTSSVLIQY